MKVIMYKNLCKQKRKKRFLIYCSRNIFKPTVIIIGVLLFMMITNLITHNFFTNIKASVEHFVNSFVKFFILWNI